MCLGFVTLLLRTQKIPLLRKGRKDWQDSCGWVPVASISVSSNILSSPSFVYSFVCVWWLVRKTLSFRFLWVQVASIEQLRGNIWGSTIQTCECSGLNTHIYCMWLQANLHWLEQEEQWSIWIYWNNYIHHTYYILYIYMMNICIHLIHTSASCGPCQESFTVKALKLFSTWFLKFNVRKDR